MLSLKLVFRVLVGLLVFGAVSACAGAVLGIAANGAGVPLSYLAGTPFSSYVVPGLILGIVVGGTQLASAVALLAHWRVALILSTIAGFGMVIWVFAELAVLTEYSWLQTLYFGLGAVELIAVLALLGVVPRLVSAPRARTVPAGIGSRPAARTDSPPAGPDGMDVAELPGTARRQPFGTARQ
ncbi:hypothetical protein E3O25_15075 [Cryobacterium sp. TMT1-3]|uniref:Uncharacterized protein n=1 Tax=Cryobacterium luteum TaxID=1424661 RepID=A0A1H8ABK4_9MICO|nr:MULTISPECIES: hypothetical protein [Cryobacterium]TFB88470.1 hypothetical protein E3O10_11720 [Cryobacterium luteum]TFC24496.1 hypothetical protein E3O25_15075 [Cryobacterium sp. TMT1-3]SEM68165.1 hypothetical protein SAMN05216281_101122 [Cryobacterium luteum]